MPSVAQANKYKEEFLEERKSSVLGAIICNIINISIYINGLRNPECSDTKVIGTNVYEMSLIFVCLNLIMCNFPMLLLFKKDSYHFFELLGTTITFFYLIFGGIVIFHPNNVECMSTRKFPLMYSLCIWSLSLLITIILLITTFIEKERKKRIIEEVLNEKF